jgi:hypothetical protein
MVRNSWGTCSLWFGPVPTIYHEHTFVPDIYDSGMTILDVSDCIKLRGTNDCKERLGHGFNFSQDLSQDLTHNYSRVWSQWHATKNPETAKTFFGPRTWKSFWWESSNLTAPNFTIGYGHHSFRGDVGTTWKVFDQVTRVVNGDVWPFLPTIGLAPSSRDTLGKSSQEKSVIANLKDANGVRSLSWSYTSTRIAASKFLLHSRTTMDGPVGH